MDAGTSLGISKDTYIGMIIGVGLIVLCIRLFQIGYDWGRMDGAVHHRVRSVVTPRDASLEDEPDRTQ